MCICKVKAKCGMIIGIDIKERGVSMATSWKNESPFKQSMVAELPRRFESGETMEEFCADHDISETTFFKWIESKPDFAAAYEAAKMKAKSYYLKLGRTYMIEEHEGARLNLGLYNRTMNTRFNLPQQRRIKIAQLAEAKSANDKLDAILKAVEKGELTSVEATQMSRLIETVVKVQEHTEFEDRLKAVEAASDSGISDTEFKEV